MEKHIVLHFLLCNYDLKHIENKELSNQIVLITEFIDGGNLSDLLGKNPKGLCEEKIQNLATG